MTNTKKIVEQVKKLREETGAGVMACKKALDDSKGDMEKAKQIIAKKGLAKAEEKAGRETNQGWVASYTHSTGKVGVVVSLLCETDFVARGQDFQTLAKEICLQVAAMNPKNEKELLDQQYIRDPSKKVKDLIKESIAKLGENIRVGSFNRIAIE
jgi:elongation factor Ts